MFTEATKDAAVTDYLRKWVEGLNRGGVSAADDAFHPDCVIHINGAPQPDLSLDHFKQMLTGLLAAFPDLHFTINDQCVAGDKVATRWTAEGTHTGLLGEIAATGKRIKIGGLIIDHTANGKVAERWELWDQMGMLQQLGVV